MGSGQRAAGAAVSVLRAVRKVGQGSVRRRLRASDDPAHGRIGGGRETTPRKGEARCFRTIRRRELGLRRTPARPTTRAAARRPVARTALLRGRTVRCCRGDRGSRGIFHPDRPARAVAGHPPCQAPGGRPDVVASERGDSRPRQPVTTALNVELQTPARSILSREKLPRMKVPALRPREQGGSEVEF